MRTGLPVGGLFILYFLHDSPSIAFFTKACMWSGVSDAGLNAGWVAVRGVMAFVLLGWEIKIGGRSTLARRREVCGWGWEGVVL
jgi:hypothetical protein